LERWNPPQRLSRKEAFILKRLKRTRKLFAFLRLHRHELLNEEFQAELEGMYRKTGAGEEPVPPALLCLALILQGYLRTADAEAVELTVMDMRWQLVLDCLGAEEPAFAQGTLQQFRERLIAWNMDRRLLERTIELAKKTKEFDWKKLPKDLRVGVDSRPLAGAGRVEDTFNLLGHAARKIIACAEKLTQQSAEEICRQANTPLFLHSSVKAGLDIDWADPEQKDQALETLLSEVASLNEWLERNQLRLSARIRPYLKAVAQVYQQDVEEASDGRAHLRQGVAQDRRVSLEDGQMRHGRKSRTKRFDGYKEHIATDLHANLILACAVTPANQPEGEAGPSLKNDLDEQGFSIDELFIDRGYINSALVEDVLARGGEVVAKPWTIRNVNRGLFTKADFKLNLRDNTIMCPAGEVEHFEPGQMVEFDSEACSRCPLRAQCTRAALGKGRTVSISDDERLQKKLRMLQNTSKGRRRLRQRAGVEHRLAHIAARKGPRARYFGIRKNLFDLRRAAVIQNLETLHRKTMTCARAAA
jgi:DDE family transposase/transposase-like protein DUF772